MCYLRLSKTRRGREGLVGGEGGWWGGVGREQGRVEGDLEGVCSGLDQILDQCCLSTKGAGNEDWVGLLQDPCS